MDKVYFWLGLSVFWFAVGAAATAVGRGIWGATWFRSSKRRLGNLWLAVRVLFGERLPMSRRTVDLAFRFGGSPGKWRADWWERHLICFLVRYVRKNGYTDPQ